MADSLYDQIVRSITNPTTNKTSALSAPSMDANGYNTNNTRLPWKSGLAVDNPTPVIDTGGGDTPWYQNTQTLGNVAGLGASLAQLASLPSQLKYANLQSKALKQNINTAREEQERRNTNIANFNSLGV